MAKPEIQKIKAWEGPGNRAETGPMQFGDDWPGVFFRGDEALLFARSLGAVAIALKTLNLAENDKFLLRIVEGLEATLSSCSVGDTGWPPTTQKEKADV